MMDVRPDWKPVSEGGIGRKKPPRGYRTRGRQMANAEEWRELRVEKIDGHGCRVCERRVGPFELHHLVPRSQQGDDVADNLVALCASCHFAVTRNDPEHLADLAERLSDAEYAYIIGKLGENALERLFGVYRRGKAAS